MNEVKDHLNSVIEYVWQSKNENKFYYGHLQHLLILLIKEINSDQSQTKISYVLTRVK